MADIDLTGSSNLVSLVYNDQPAPVDPKVLQEKLKREKQLKKEDEKMKRQREKEKEKEDKRLNKMTSPHNKRVTIEHVKYTSPEESDGVKPREEREDEEGGKDKADFRCGAGMIMFLIIIFLLSIGIAFLASFKLTEQSLGGNRAIVQEEEDGIVRIGALFSSDDDENEEEVTEGRLPRTIQPIWYNLTTRIYLPGFVDLPRGKLRTFESTLLSKFHVLSETQQLELNSALLSIPETNDGWQIMEEKDGSLVQSGLRVTNVTINATAETVVLEFDNPLKTGSDLVLRVSFSGNLSTTKLGPYISTYRTAAGEEREMGVVHSAPHYARRLLPCMDEPDRKAVFKVTIEHPKGSRALANNMETDTESVAETPSFVRTHFLETPKMSSYLLSFLVSDLKMKESKSKGGVTVRAFAHPDLLDNVDVALNTTVRMVDFYENEFGIPYPLAKLDVVSIRDFTEAAVENWGLIMMKESFALFDHKINSPLDKRRTIQLVSHEVSHQWFGNLVTMKWWSDLWLNEAFATHSEFASPSRAGIEPGMEDSFITDLQNEFFTEDSLSSSRPVSTPITKPVEMEQLFDSITYSKAGSVVRMLEDVVGMENFKKGIREYLKKYSYSNASPDDLLESIKGSLPEELSSIGSELKAFVRRYTKQNGYPVLNVERPDTMHIEISQEWFQRDSNSDSLNKHGAKYNHIWEVPLFYEINQETKPVTWMTEGIRLPSNQSDLLNLNRDSMGLYRVNYDPRSWIRIHEQLNKNHTYFSDLTRFRLIDDAFAMAEVGRVPYEVALDSIQYLPSEEEEIPVLGTIHALEFIQSQIGDGEDAEKVKGFILRVLSPFYKKFVNWEKDSFDNVTAVRAEFTRDLVRALWRSGHKGVADNLHKIFEDSLLSVCKDEKSIASQCSKVPPLIRSFAYCEGVKRGRGEEFESILRLYKNEIASSEATRLIAAMKCSRDTKYLKRLYQALLDKKGEGIFSGHSFDEFILLSEGNHELSKKIYNEFFFENHEKLFKKYLSTNDQVASQLADFLTANTKSELAEIESFLLSNPSMDDLEGFARAVERGRAKINWQRKHSKRLVEEFEKRTNRV